MAILKTKILLFLLYVFFLTYYVSDLSAQFTIDPGGLVSIKDGSSMYIDMDFKINAVNGSSGYFSDQTNSGDVSITGNVSVERYMVADVWHNVSSPVSSETSAVFAGTDMVWYYDESLILNDWNFGWVWQPSGPLSVPKGYDVTFYTTDVLVDYTGTGAELNTGSYSIGLTNTNSTPTEIASHKGWNLVANPYPSPVDWQSSSGWNKSSINDAKYIWDGPNDIYTIWLGGGAPVGINGGTQYIPSNQGFWVQATANGNFGVDNATRCGFITGTPDFYKQAEVIDYPFLSLVVHGETHSDEAVVRFIDGNTSGFDRNMDASKLFSRNPDVPQIYIQENDFKFALNTYSVVAEDVPVPLHFRCDKPGYYSLEVADRTNLSQATEVYLKDEFEQKIINLSEELTYDFYHNPSSNDSRFKLFFNPSEDVIKNISPDQYYSIYSDGISIKVIKNTVKETPARIVIYNMHGQVVYKKSLADDITTTIQLTQPRGCYIVSILSTDYLFSTKIIL